MSTHARGAAVRHRHGSRAGDAGEVAGAVTGGLANGPWARPTTRCTPRRLLPALGLALCLAVACVDEAAEQRAVTLADATLALGEGRPDDALAGVREVWDDARPDPHAALVAAAACLDLARAKDAIAWAEKGLAAEPGEALTADLEWARGTAHARRFHEVGRDEDWRTANTSLEIGASAGEHRVDSAMLLALLQVSGGRDNRDRFTRYARRVLQLDPTSDAADRVRGAAEQLGIDL